MSRRRNGRGRNVKFITFLILLVVSTVSCKAGEIYGTVKMGKAHAGSGILIKLHRCVRVAHPEGKRYECTFIDSTITDKRSSYRFDTKKKGEYKLEVYYRECVLDLDVYSYEEDSERYDLIIRKADGSYTIRSE